MLASVDHKAAFHRRRLGAEGRLAGSGGAVGFGEGLREEVAFLDHAAVDGRAAHFVAPALLAAHRQVVGQPAGPQHGAGVHVEGECRGAAPEAQLRRNLRITRIVHP